MRGFSLKKMCHSPVTSSVCVWSFVSPLRQLVSHGLRISLHRFDVGTTIKTDLNFRTHNSSVIWYFHCFTRCFLFKRKDNARGACAGTIKISLSLQVEYSAHCGPMYKLLLVLNSPTLWNIFRRSCITCILTYIWCRQKDMTWIHTYMKTV